MENNKHLIPDTQTLQKFARVNTSVLKDSFLPFELDAQSKYLLPYLGKVLLDQLTDHVADASTFPSWADTQEKKDIFEGVLKLSQNTLAKFTLYLAAPHMDLHLSEMGFVVTESQSAAPASAERVRKLVQAYLSGGYDTLETMLRFLEKHHSLIEPYKDSEAFVLANGNLINSAEKFDRIVSISGSRRTFISLKSEIDNIERLVIEPMISPQMADKLRQQLRENILSDDNKKLLDLVQRALAHLVMAEAITTNMPLDEGHDTHGNSGKRYKTDGDAVFLRKERLTGVGNNYLAWIKKLLEKYPEKYPEYQASEQFVQSRTYQTYDNTQDDNQVFIFGQP